MKKKTTPLPGRLDFEQALSLRDPEHMIVIGIEVVGLHEISKTLGYRFSDAASVLCEQILKSIYKEVYRLDASLFAVLLDHTPQKILSRMEEVAKMRLSNMLAEEGSIYELEFLFGYGYGNRSLTVEAILNLSDEDLLAARRLKEQQRKLSESGEDGPPAWFVNYCRNAHLLDDPYEKKLRHKRFLKKSLYK